MCLIHERHAARSAYNLSLCSVFAIAFASFSAHAEETNESLVFYPPFSVVEITNRVQERQDALGSTQFNTMVTVQYEKRIDWINACAWLKAQSDGILKFYKPPQDVSADYNYFCSVSKTYRDASDDSLSELHTLVGEFTRQFGGTTTLWGFDFREISDQEIDSE